ncbi:glucuronosyltransferase [Methylobacterium sp. C25]|uniref:glycosyltransferase n=1 Tax=Methylobacterium sp. C25 TaxID=2721622 RepID=UPI001F1E244B|nr:glycosyltransferase [Methylobacterium sp. C25]MCE4225056.1 glucuronosyltransferase [Methylobacterium sp. C25]
MIFITVGTQGPFDRLVRAVDDWAGQTGRRDLFAQVGPSDYSPKQFKAKQFLHPDEFRASVETSEFTIAHAGMGSIITALEFGKRVIVMPRRCNLREHRNDHQVATAERLSQLGLVQAVFDEAELHQLLNRLEVAKAADRLSATASPQLLSVLRSFVKTGTLPMGVPA